MSGKENYERSSLREKILEHLFIAELLRLLWNAGVFDVEILRSEFDAYGYDLVLTRGELTRHIQIKTIKANKVSISSLLCNKPSGCVVWIRLNTDLTMGGFLYFGGSPGEPMPELNGYPHSRRPTHNKAGERPRRPHHHDLTRKDFRGYKSLPELIPALLGTLTPATLTP